MLPTFAMPPLVHLLHGSSYGSTCSCDIRCSMATSPASSPSALAASSKASAPVQPKAPAEPKSPATPKGPASSKASPKKGQHRLPHGYTEVRAGLVESKKAAQQALKLAIAQNKAQASKKRRLMVKAAGLDIEDLIKIVSMKVEVPDIECPHCECSISVGKTLSEAYEQVKKGDREVTLDKPGKPLKT